MSKALRAQSRESDHSRFARVGACVLTRPTNESLPADGAVALCAIGSSRPVSAGGRWVRQSGSFCKCRYDPRTAPVSSAEQQADLDRPRRPACPAGRPAAHLRCSCKSYAFARARPFFKGAALLVLRTSTRTRAKRE